MPLHGKIVVVKRTGGDGTEFPLTASCLFGRKADCDIRIQLPQVSKEHCRIDLNENKEVILTNLSSVNPTLINGEQLQQSERLKDGDLITIVDRSFRFQSPPAPTPKKFAKGSKAGTPNPHLRNGTNHNIQRALEQAKEEDPKLDGDAQQSKPVSPFSDLYQMIRKSLDVKTPRQSSGTYIQSQRKSNVSTNRNTSEVAEAKGSDGETVAKAKNISIVAPLSEKKRNNSPQVLSSDVVTPGKDAQNVKSEARSPQKRQRVTPQKSGAGDAVEKMCTPAPKSPLRCRSQEATPAKEHVKEMPSPQNTNSPRATGKGVPRKRKSAELVLNSPAPQMKKRHVSFGGYLVPELFDKKMPPDSPLRKGENPRRRLCLAKPKQSVLRRASVIGLSKKAQSPAKKSPESPKTSVKKSPKPRSPSPKDSSPQKKTPKSRTPSPQRKLPKSTPASPREKSPGKKSPKPKTPSAKASFSGEKSAKLTASEKTPRTPSSKWASPALKSPKPNIPSAESSLSGEKSTKSTKSSSPSSSEKTSKFSTPRRTSSSGNKWETPLTKGPTSNEMPQRAKRASPRLTPPKTSNQLPVKTPQGSQAKIASAQGRFSVSRVETPSPVANDDVIAPARSVTVTPKVPLRRKSMKSTSRKTPLTKSAIKMLRRSGISRAALKATCSWADTVRFGQAKVRAGLPVLRTVKRAVPIAKVSKKLASGAQTPVRKQLGHASTGHAASPVTIVVGRASKRQVTHPVGAPPKVVLNTAISKKNLNMDEDLSGISDMFKTPSKEGRRRSEHRRGSSAKTPLVANEPAVADPSVLNTPEEPGEMAVSPLSLASTMKAGRYNKEAVKRLLSASRESSFVADASALEKTSEFVEQQCAEMMASAVTTPEQKPQVPECLTSVKRLLKTPKQKTEPLEDLRGKLLKTPKQKSEQTECLTAVKRIFTTPEQREPIDVAEKLFQTPTDAEVLDVSLNGVGDQLETRDRPPPAQETRDLPEPTNSSTVKVASSPTDGLSAIMKTPRQRHAPVEDFLGIERLMRTPKERGEPVEENFGIKQLMRLGLEAEATEVFVDVPSVACESSEATQAVSQAAIEDTPGVTETEMDTAYAKKSVRGRRVKAADPVTEESSQYPVVSAPVRGRRGKKVEPAEEAQAAPKPKRGRYAKKVETVQEPPAESEPAVTDSVAPLEEEAVKPRRGRYAKKALKQTETVPQPDAASLPQPESEPVVADSVESLEEEEAVKPRRGRYAKKALKQTETVPQPTAATLPEPESEPVVADSVASLTEEAVKPQKGRKPKQPSTRSKKAQYSSRSDDVCQHDVAQDIEEVRDDRQEQMPTELHEKKPTESLQEEEITEDAPVVQKKPLRGRRGNPVEDEQQGAALEEALVSAPARAVRRKKTEATAPPAGRLTTRSRNTKTKVQPSDALTETVPEKDTSQEDFQTPAADSVVKPSKGRKTKRAPEPEKTLAAEEVQPPAPTDKRGSRRKVISETAEPQELEKVTSEETNYQSKPLARGTRGQNAKRKKEQENIDTASIAAPRQPTKTPGNKKGDVENLVPVEAEGPPVSETEQISEPASGLAKTRRGVVRKQNQAAVTPDSTETGDAAIETATVKPQRRVRAKQVEDVPTTTQVPEEKSELKQKPQRGRGLKDDIKQVNATERVRRGPASSRDEAQKGSVAVPESAPTSAEPIKRGKRPLAKSDPSEVNEKQSNASSQSNATTQEPQNCSRTVKWNQHVEVREIPKRTPRAVRGKRSNIGDQMETQSQSESEIAEEDVSEKAAEPQPAKRARRGAKEAESTAKIDTGKAEDVETQPKNRRGRSAKKC